MNSEIARTILVPLCIILFFCGQGFISEAQAVAETTRAPALHGRMIERGGIDLADHIRGTGIHLRRNFRKLNTSRFSKKSATVTKDTPIGLAAQWVFQLNGHSRETIFQIHDCLLRFNSPHS